MNVELATTRASNHIKRMVNAAVKAGDLAAARHLLQALESLKVGASTLKISGDSDIQKWGLTQSEMALAKSPNNYINAIKELRNRTNLGLKEAKDRVDAYRGHLYDTNVLERPQKVY